ncbi:MAG: metallophosphoesterase [Clostridia bacterium]|nr:metallophosphoesterase [Clostridia bacterium]
MTKKKKRLLWACIILSAIILLTVAEFLYSNLHLTVSRYTVRSEKAEGAFRVVFLADLHGREFGKDNGRLLKKIAAENPDVIALPGDIISQTADDDEVERMCSFVREAAKIAPVYYSLGNHEYNYMKANDTDLPELLRQCGATVLINEFAEVEINGTPVRIGGNLGYYRQPFMTIDDPELRREELAFAEAFEDTELFKLLLDHIPTGWLDWNKKDREPVDLVLSGHYHGGNAMIPFTDRGLYAPYVGWFPPYAKGMFEGKTATCILTTGLAGGKGVPRLFNPPEIVVVDITGEE